MAEVEDQGDNRAAQTASLFHPLFEPWFEEKNQASSTGYEGQGSYGRQDWRRTRGFLSWSELLSRSQHIVKLGPDVCYIPIHKITALVCWCLLPGTTRSRLWVNFFLNRRSKVGRLLFRTSLRPGLAERHEQHADSSTSWLIQGSLLRPWRILSRLSKANPFFRRANCRSSPPILMAFEGLASSGNSVFFSPALL